MKNVSTSVKLWFEIRYLHKRMRLNGFRGSERLCGSVNIRNIFERLLTTRLFACLCLTKERKKKREREKENVAFVKNT